MKTVRFEKKKNSNESLASNSFSDRVEYFKEQLMNKEALMGYLSILADKLIRKFGWEKLPFELNNLYAIWFMGGDMDYLMREMGEEYSLVFQHISEDRIYCVCANARMDENGDIEAYTQAFVLDDYETGNNRWSEVRRDKEGVLNETESEEDIFDLDAILNNHDMAWVAEHS